MLGANRSEVAEANGQPFRILSIEGGGILGAFAAGALEEMERATSRRIVDHFDLIAGTSTGGIIAIGLAMGLPAQQICQFYLQHGREIFPDVGFFSRPTAAVRHLVRPKYVTSRLNRLLQSILSGGRWNSASAWSSNDATRDTRV